MVWIIMLVIEWLLFFNRMILKQNFWISPYSISLDRWRDESVDMLRTEVRSKDDDHLEYFSKTTLN